MHSQILAKFNDDEEKVQRSYKQMHFEDCFDPCFENEIKSFEFVIISSDSENLIQIWFTFIVRIHTGVCAYCNFFLIRVICMYGGARAHTINVRTNTSCLYSVALDSRLRFLFGVCSHVCQIWVYVCLVKEMS